MRQEGMCTWMVEGIIRSGHGREEPCAEVEWKQKENQVMWWRNEELDCVVQTHSFPVDALLKDVLGRLRACGGAVVQLDRHGSEKPWIGSYGDLPVLIEGQCTINSAGVGAVLVAPQRVGGSSTFHTDNLGLVKGVESGPPHRGCRHMGKSLAVCQRVARGSRALGDDTHQKADSCPK